MSALALNISNLPIRQDSEGRYSLNDLHKASGNSAKHKPSEYLRNQQAKDLVYEIELEAENPAIKIIKGRGLTGTYACKEMVYAYAMWISPAFTLKVIHAYDNQLFGKTEQLPAYISESEASQFKKSIEALCGGNRKRYSELYRKVYDYYGITSYKNIPAGKLEESARLTGMKILALGRHKLPSVGELLPEQDIPSNTIELSLNGGTQLMTVILNARIDNAPQNYLVLTIGDVVTVKALAHDDVATSKNNFINRLKADGYIVMKKADLLGRLKA